MLKMVPEASQELQILGYVNAITKCKVWVIELFSCLDQQALQLVAQDEEIDHTKCELY